MWMIFGVVASITGLLNGALARHGKKNKWLGYCSLSLAALTSTLLYRDASVQVLNEDWSGLANIVPPTSKLLLPCVLALILVNSIPLWLEAEEEE